MVLIGHYCGGQEGLGHLLHPERRSMRASSRVPWVCGYSFLHTARSLASQCAAHRGGIHGMTSGQPPWPVHLLSMLNVVQRIVVSAHSRQKFVVYCIGQQCDNVNCRSRRFYAWSDSKIGRVLRSGSCRATSFRGALQLRPRLQGLVQGGITASTPIARSSSGGY